MTGSAVVFIVSVAAALAAPGTGGGTTVTLSVYSGLKDPTWTLSEAEDKRFVACLDGLTAGGPEGKPKPQLGYRGFEVAGFRGYDELTVWNGTVEATCGGKTYRWHDKGRTLERVLLETSKGHVRPATYERVAAEIGKD